MDSVLGRGVLAPTFGEVQIWSVRHSVRPENDIVGDAGEDFKKGCGAYVVENPGRCSPRSVC